MKTKPIGYMVFWDDEMGLCVPHGTDPECAGAIEANTSAPLMFADKAAARKAIEISRRNALLRQSQGLAFNEDFTSGLKRLVITPVFSAGKGKK